MKNRIIFILLLFFNIPLTLLAQDITQTIKGTVFDDETSTPLIGATVVILESNPLIGTTTDLDGKFKRVFGSNFLGCPCGGVVKDNLLYVPELCARLAILDEEDKLISYLGQNEETCNISSWPNHPKEFIQPGKFNSPHHLAVDNHSNIFVVEWIIGGRVTKLEKIE